MKLDKIKFAQLVNWIGRRGLQLDSHDVRQIDEIINIEVPEAPKALTHEVGELLRCMLSANSNGFIPAIKAYRQLTGAGLKESIDAIEKHRPSVAQWSKGQMNNKLNLFAASDSEHAVIAKFIESL